MGYIDLKILLSIIWFILPLVICVTEERSNNGIEYHGTSNVRYQKPDLWLLPPHQRPMPIPISLTTADTPPNKAQVVSELPIVSNISVTSPQSNVSTTLKPSYIPHRRPLLIRQPTNVNDGLKKPPLLISATTLPPVTDTVQQLVSAVPGHQSVQEVFSQTELKSPLPSNSTIPSSEQFLYPLKFISVPDEEYDPKLDVTPQIPNITVSLVDVTTSTPEIAVSLNTSLQSVLPIVLVPLPVVANGTHPKLNVTPQIPNITVSLVDVTTSTPEIAVSLNTSLQSVLPIVLVPLPVVANGTQLPEVVDSQALEPFRSGSGISITSERSVQSVKEPKPVANSHMATITASQLSEISTTTVLPAAVVHQSAVKQPQVVSEPHVTIQLITSTQSTQNVDFQQPANGATEPASPTTLSPLLAIPNATQLPVLAAPQGPEPVLSESGMPLISDITVQPNKEPASVEPESELMPKLIQPPEIELTPQPQMNLTFQSSPGPNFKPGREPVSQIEASLQSKPILSNPEKLIPLNVYDLKSVTNLQMSTIAASQSPQAATTLPLVMTITTVSPAAGDPQKLVVTNPSISVVNTTQPQVVQATQNTDFQQTSNVATQLSTATPISQHSIGNVTQPKMRDNKFPDASLSVRGMPMTSKTNFKSKTGNQLVSYLHQSEHIPKPDRTELISEPQVESTIPTAQETTFTPRRKLVPQPPTTASKLISSKPAHFSYPLNKTFKSLPVLKPKSDKHKPIRKTQLPIVATPQPPTVATPQIAPLFKTLPHVSNQSLVSVTRQLSNIATVQPQLAPAPHVIIQLIKPSELSLYTAPQPQAPKALTSTLQPTTTAESQTPSYSILDTPKIPAPQTEPQVTVKPGELGHTSKPILSKPVQSPYPIKLPEPNLIAVSESVSKQGIVKKTPVVLPLLPRPEPIRKPTFDGQTQSVTQYPITSSIRRVTKNPSAITTDAERLLEDSLTPNFICTKRNGYYAVKNECDTYIQCKQYNARKLSCPDGLYFNSSAKYYEYPCAHPSTVKCNTHTGTQKLTPTEKCPRQYGLFSMNDGDCSKYIMCNAGVATIMNCPVGLVFNPITESCDWLANVPQCNPLVFKDYICPDPTIDDFTLDSNMIFKYKYGQHCKLYIACQRGYPRLLSCESGLAFDESSHSCIKAEYVQNCTTT